jgi:hypothetical protein
MGSGGIDPKFLTSAVDGCEFSASCSGLFIPVSIVCEAGWAPEQVWTIWSKEKVLAADGN